MQVGRRGPDQGLFQLPGVDDIESARATPSGYDHVPPWEPPALLNDKLELEEESDIDPDAIDPDTWADGLDDASG